MQEPDANGAAGERERLLMAMADACAAAGPPKSAQAADALTALFAPLLADAPPCARRSLAARVEAEGWAPAALVQALAEDRRHIDWRERDGPLGEGEAEDRLVDKLQASGQLRPGYLLRALREGRLALFEAGLARLGGFPRAEVRRALDAEGGRRLALGCAAIGIDRSVWPTLLALVQGLNDGRPYAIPVDPTIATALATPPDVAAHAFRQATEPA